MAKAKTTDTKTKAKAKTKAKPKAETAATAPVLAAPVSQEVPTGRSSDRWGSMVPGLTLIAIGSIFLLQSYTNFRLDNWWALFLLVPAFMAWSSAYRFYRRDGAVGPRAWSAFIAGLLPATVAVIFLNSLAWSKIWPVFLLIIGLTALGPKAKSKA